MAAVTKAATAQKKKRGRPVGSKKKVSPAGKGKALGSSPLPPPLEMVATASPTGAAESPGLLGGVRSLFEKKPSMSEYQPSAVDSSSESPANSPASSSSEAGPLSQEAARLLASVPESIGGTVDDTGGAPLPNGGAATGSDLAMLGAEIVDEEAAGAILKMGFGLLADLRKRECYRLAGENASGAARHWALAINAMWAKWAPSLLADMSQTFPGLLQAIALTAIPLGVAVMADVKETRAAGAVRASARPVGSPSSSSAPLPPKPPTGGIVYDGSTFAGVQG